jgi:hypothetical protein
MRNNKKRRKMITGNDDKVGGELLERTTTINRWYGKKYASIQKEERKMKKISVLILVVAVFTVMLMAACNHGPDWNADSMSALTKGKTTKQEVIDRFGEPDKRSMDSNKNTVLEYRKVSEGAENKLVRIGSLGIMGGKNSAAYADILTIYFDKSERVKDFKYDEKVSILSGR